MFNFKYMASFKFKLRNPSETKPTPIYLYVRWNNVLLPFATKETINPKYWDIESNSIILKVGYPKSIKELKVKLSWYLSESEALFLKFENEYKRKPSKSELNTILKKELLKNESIEIKDVVDYSLLNYIKKFIVESETRTNEKTGKPIAKSTIDTYNQVYNLINNYSIKRKKKFVFNDITLDFYFDFHSYLVNEGLATNTIGKRIAILKTIMREATERGLNTNLSFQSKRFKVTREKTENIYLNESELMEIYKLDLSKNKKLDRVRDLFLVGCYTGLRFSDLSVLSNQNIKDNFIEIETQKTRESVAIPLHPIVRNIIDKHKGGLPRALSLQRMNIYLKKIGEMIESLNVNTSKKMTKGGLEITTNSKKYLQITTHTARRSFASNLFVKGVPSQTIMKITGHKTEKSFMQYIKITPKENAKLIQMIWDKESKLSIVS
jgi:integrase